MRNHIDRVAIALIVLGIGATSVAVACGSSTSDSLAGGPTDAGSTEASAFSDAGTDVATPVGCDTFIDFETIPGATPADGLPISNQFAATYGLTFALEDGGIPILAKVGNPATAFNNNALEVGDTVNAGQPDCGTYFLTDDGVIGAAPPPLVISYRQLVAAAYGEILDIDDPEAWMVEARDNGGNVIDSRSLASGDAGTGDGVVTSFSFSHASADIRSLRIRYTGDVSALVGLAFDNFSPSCSAPPKPR